MGSFMIRLTQLVSKVQYTQSAITIYSASTFLVTILAFAGITTLTTSLFISSYADVLLIDGQLKREEYKANVEETLF